MAVDSVNQQSSPFVPAFVIGTGAGLAVAKGFPPKFLKTELTLDQIKGLENGDKFVTSGDLTKEQKESVETVKKFLNNKTKTDPKDAKTTATPTTTKSDKKINEELKKTFANEEEIEKEKLLDGNKPKDFKAKIKLFEDDVNAAQKAYDEKELDLKINDDARARSDARLSKEASFKNEKEKELSETTKKYIKEEKNKLPKLQEKTEAAQKAVDEAPADISKTDKAKLQKTLERAEGEYDRVKLNTITKESEKYAYKATIESKKLEREAVDKQEKATKAREAADKKGISEAQYKTLDEKATKAEAEAKKAKAHSDELKEVVDKGGYDAEKARLQTAKTTKSTAEKSLKDEGINLDAKKFEHQALKSKLELYEAAGKEKGATISKSALKEKLATRVEAESTGKLEKAIEGLKGHIEKVGPGWGKAIAIAVGFGVILGGIAHLMGGSKKAPEEAAPVA